MQRHARGSHAGGTHAGLNHARALGNPAEPHGLASELKFHGDLLRLRIAGHDGLSGGSIIEFLDDLPDAGADVRHGQLQADPASAADEYILRLE